MNYDIIIVGAGPAGMAAAVEAARLDAKFFCWMINTALVVKFIAQLKPLTNPGKCSGLITCWAALWLRAYVRQTSNM